MSAISTPALGRSRRQQQADPETREQPAGEAAEAPVAAQDGDGSEGSPAGENGAEQAAERKRRERKPNVVATGREPTWRVKVSAFLTAPTVWRLKHMIADSPGRSEADVIEEALTPVLKDREYPTKPDWLRKLEKEEAERKEEERRRKVVSAN